LDAHKAVQRVENRVIAVFGPKTADKVAEQLSRCADALSATRTFQEWRELAFEWHLLTNVASQRYGK